jgi:NAD(P)H-flavin reductase
VRDVGLATAALCRLRPGDWAGVRGPYGSTWPLEEASGRDVVIVAGGLGMAPLRPVLHALLRRPRDEGRISLCYGTRTPDDLLYRRELGSWASRAGLDLHLTVDAGAPGWQGNVGVVTTLLRRAAIDPAGAMAMICGPEVMMRFTIAELQRLGMPEPAIWVSMERSMHCAIGLCGHCQLGPAFVCKDGPVFRLDAVSWMLGLREV